MGTQPLPKKGAEPPPQFSSHVYCGQTAGCIKMALGTEVGLDPGHIVLDEEPAPISKKGTEPPISAHLYCRQTAGWIKMALGMEVGLSSGDFVLNADPASRPLKGHSPPIFGPYLMRPNGCIDQDVTSYREGERGPHLTQSRLGRGLAPYQVTN